MSALRALYRLMGGGAPPSCSINFTGGPYIVFDSYPSPAKAGIRLNTAGGIQEWDGQTGLSGTVGSWGSGGCVMSDYDFRFDTPTGGVNVGEGSDPDETWINGGSNIDWFVYLEGTGVGVDRAIGTVRIRPAGGGADIDTESANFEVDLS